MSTATTDGAAAPAQFMSTSGATEPVWVHTEPYSRRPRFTKLKDNVSAEVCVIGSGIAGIHTAYELVKRGLNVVMLEAREVLSAETSRTSGHLAKALDDGYIEIEKKHGREGARIAAESHSWAIDRVGEVTQELGIDCEYRKLPGVEISQYPRGDPKHDEEIDNLKKEVTLAKELGLDARLEEGYAVQGWEGKPDQRDAAIFEGQATFHPTKYLLGVMR